MEQQRRPGLTETLIVWALLAAVAVAAFATYSRLPPEELYHTSGTGIEAGASRAGLMDQPGDQALAEAGLVGDEEPARGIGSEEAPGDVLDGGALEVLERGESGCGVEAAAAHPAVTCSSRRCASSTVGQKTSNPSGSTRRPASRPR